MELNVKDIGIDASICVQLKRQHSFEPLSASTATRKSPASTSPTAGSTPPKPTIFEALPPQLLSSTSFDPTARAEVIGSPVKRARASVSGADDDSLRQTSGFGDSGLSADIMGRIEQDRASKKEKDEEEEL